MRGQSKHRDTATKHGAKYPGKLPVIGKKCEIWRKKDADGTWQSLPYCKGAKKDYLVHRYARLIGYKHSAEAVCEEVQDEAIGAARADVALNDQNKSHPDRVSKMGLVECFVLEHGGGSDFHYFLLAVQDDLANFENNGVVPTEKHMFVRPSDGLMLLFTKVMRGNPNGSSPIPGVPGRGHKVGYIKSLVGAINATTIEFHPDPHTKSAPALQLRIAHWVAEDDEVSAPAFDMEQDTLRRHPHPRPEPRRTTREEPPATIPSSLCRIINNVMTGRQPVGWHERPPRRTKCCHSRRHVWKGRDP
ncbi:hypothetical protein M885DRAFT_501929 [Pelagophyceae sp. CCMP2097]|nr:hypothetical protein M885DRAFT_501929 [Pelagophyceae sp. CCMP2097]